jgi:2-polyprenyl-3-methyl-5-hydroxy-6-metoxy-1,4-benzoquinol methylase
MITSPLTHSQNVTLLKTFNTDQLINDWKNIFNIDITEELHNYPEVYLYQCNESKLRFFFPFDIAGSDKLYEQLEEFDWYYMPRKWEHDVAVEDLRGCNEVLEVGCGRGDFVKRLCQEEKIKTQGIELNSIAVDYGQRHGVPIYQQNIHDLAAEKTNSFDAICTFQVLEHIPDSIHFLESMIQLLRPHGKLIISVPNYLSFTRYCDKNLLDQPPHHMTQWSLTTFHSLTQLLPIKLEHYSYEPLAEYHVDWYLRTQIARLPKIWALSRIANKAIQVFIKPLLKKSLFLRRLITGHTIYICFSKSC